MHSDLQKLLGKLREHRNFNVAAWVDAKCKLLNKYLRDNGLKGCVISMSGGVDSSLTAALCLKAKTYPDSPLQRVIGIAQPIHSTPSIQNRALEVAHDIGLEIFTVDQTEIFDKLTNLVETQSKLAGDEFSRGQMRSYMRTPVAFYVAQLLSANKQASVVVGTGNKDEDGYLFYFCKAGDGVADIQLIADLHKSEVFAVSKALNIPKSVLEAAPSADLWEGQTDEDELGCSYDFVELFTELGDSYNEEERNKFLSDLSSDAKKEYDELGGKITAIHRRNSHKKQYPLNLNVL